MKISQREARRLRRENVALVRIEMLRRNAWVGEWPGGVHIGTVDDAGEGVSTAIETARKLGHAVIAVHKPTDNSVRFFALPLAATVTP